MSETCQATKRVVQKSGRYLFPLGIVRCSQPERHDGDHAGEHATVKGPEFTWPRGKQAQPFFMVQPKG